MDTIYSLTLLVSFAAGIIALILALTLFMKHPQLGPGRLRSFRHALTVIICVAVIMLFVSLAVHVAFGHRPGSEQALGIIGFFAIHPSYLLAAALPPAAGLLAWLYCRKLGRQQVDNNA